MLQPPIVVLTGPTGSGKSALAVRIASEINAEIVNADSVQLYRGFRIGAGQPSEVEKSACPHHLFEVLDPSVRSDAAEFISLAEEEITRLHQAGISALFVGGTGLYIRALLHGLVAVPEIPDSEITTIRELLFQKRLEATSVDEYFAWVREFLRREDPMAEEKLHPSDTQRIVRAIAVRRVTGTSLYAFQEVHAHAAVHYPALVLYLEPERKQLYEQIDARVEAMWERGLCDEVESLLSLYGPGVHPLSSIGYRHALQYLQGNWSREESISLMKRDTRRFAKRQMTWWRNQPLRLGWEVTDYRDSECSIEEICNIYSELKAEVTTHPPFVRFLSFRGVM